MNHKLSFSQSVKTICKNKFAFSSFSQTRKKLEVCQLFLVIFRFFIRQKGLLSLKQQRLGPSREQVKYDNPQKLCGSKGKVFLRHQKCQRFRGLTLFRRKNVLLSTHVNIFTKETYAHVAGMILGRRKQTHRGKFHFTQDFKF